MKIDTRYTKTGDALVDIVLQSDAERRLTDVQLARIGLHQDLLLWADEGDEVSLPGGRMIEFPPLPGDCLFSARRDGDRVTVSYGKACEPDVRLISPISHTPA